ncbi:MAG: TolC family protein [Mariniphaga sp.]
MMKNILCTLVLAISFLSNGVAQSLETCVNSALQNSPLLHDYNNQLLAGKFDSLLILASFKPQVNEIAQLTHFPVGSGWGYDEAITNGGNYSAMANVSQTLFNKKRISGQLQTITLLNQQLKLNEKITVIDLKKSITDQYLVAFTDFAKYQFNKSVLELLFNEQKQIKSLIDRGIYQVTDFMNLQVLITAQKIVVSQSYIQLKNDLALLHFICGITDQVEINLTKPEITVQSIPDPEHSPLSALFRIDSLKNSNSRQLIDLAYQPRISAFADAGFSAITPANITHNIGTSFGINFSIPIYDGKQRKLQNDKINLAENTRIFYRRTYSSLYKIQYNQLKNQLQLTDGLIGEIKNQLSEQERLIDLYRIELDKGMVRFMDFLTILNNYSVTKINFLATEMNRMQIINQLNYLK